jgi:D-alanyl-D-alanine dipeptidase
MIKVKECHEPLVDIKKICPRIVVALGRERMKVAKAAYLRQTVAEMIRRAEKELPRGMTFIIGDAWRPQFVQEEIQRRFTEHFSKKYPRWSLARVRQEVNKFVAPARGRYVSGHMTGGAVDLRLWYRGRKLPMKSARLTYQENAQSLQPKLPSYIQANRQMMFAALQAAGLSNYPQEYWHWSYGDVWWAKRNKKSTAIYGQIATWPLVRDSH